MNKPRVILCGPREFVENCRQATNFYGVDVVGEVFHPEDLFAQVDHLRPDGVLAPVDMEWKKTIFNLASLRPNIKGYLSGGITVSIWKEIQDLPYRNVTTVKGKPEDAVRTAAENLKRISPTGFRFDDREPITSSVVKGPGAVDVVEKFIVPVYSTKGGVGKTVISVNAAAILGMWCQSIEKKSGQTLRTVLLDFNADYGNSMSALGYSNLEPEQIVKIKTVAHWSGLSATAGWDDIEQCLNYHERSNLYYLAPPQEAQERMAFTAEIAERILFLTKKYFHFIFIDLGVALDKRDPAVVALDNATSVLFVVDMKYDTICKAAEFCKYEMQRLFGDLSKVSLLVNRVRRTWFDVKDIMALFEDKVGYVLPLRAQLPEEKEMDKYDGRGAPFVCFKPTSPFSKEISLLCKSLLGTRTLQLLPGEKKSSGSRKNNIFKKIVLPWKKKKGDELENVFPLH